MAGQDPITEKQVRYIYSLAEGAVSFYDDEEDLDRLVRPIYGCNVDEMNRSQASMLIDDLKASLGEFDGTIDYPSIFSTRE